MNKTQSITVIAALGITASANAAMIVYNFAGVSDPMTVGGGGRTILAPATSNDFGSGITASSWSASSPVRSLGFDGGRVQAQKSLDTDTHTFTVTIPALVGQTVSFTNLSFDWGEFGSEGADPTWTISSSQGTIAPNSGSAADGSSNSSNLTLTGLTGLNNTSVTFTLLDNAQGNNKNNTFYTWFDNVTLTGEVVVPEPASLSLLGLGSLFLGRRRRD